MSDSERLIVAAILQKHLPPGTTTHVFGSRASGHCKPWSDLDLVLEAAEPLPLSLVAAIREAFEDSALPWKVDIVDRKAVRSSFGRLIDQSKVRWN